MHVARWHGVHDGLGDSEVARDRAYFGLVQIRDRLKVHRPIGRLPIEAEVAPFVSVGRADDDGAVPVALEERGRTVERGGARDAEGLPLCPGIEREPRGARQRSDGRDVRLREGRLPRLGAERVAHHTAAARRSILGGGPPRVHRKEQTDDPPQGARLMDRTQEREDEGRVDAAAHADDCRIDPLVAKPA